jgi:hypothetical protein
VELSNCWFRESHSSLQVVVLGIVQGITELLPVSSTAHLRVIPGLPGWRDPGSAFSAAMQLASFVAVATHFGRTSASSLETASRRSPDATINRRTFACCSPSPSVRPGTPAHSQRVARPGQGRTRLAGLDYAADRIGSSQCHGTLGHVTSGSLTPRLSHRACRSSSADVGRATPAH